MKDYRLHTQKNSRRLSCRNDMDAIQTATQLIIEYGKAKARMKWDDRQHGKYNAYVLITEGNRQVCHMEV
jgi:hypothetical protein